MGAAPRLPTWTAGKAIDGNTNQSYLSNSCAITDVYGNRNTSIWWRVWLQKKFNVAYIEIYFRSDSKYMCIKIISIKVSIVYCVIFCNTNCLLIMLLIILIININNFEKSYFRLHTCHIGFNLSLLIFKLIGDQRDFPFTRISHKISIHCLIQNIWCITMILCLDAHRLL